jgi:P-type conjugative transfer protein TrbG
MRRCLITLLLVSAAVPALAAPRRPSDPYARVAEANAAARVQPSAAGYVNAVQVYGWSDGALYQVYAAPGDVTDIVLEPGETLAGTGPVAAGDTVRWVIGDTESGAGAGKCVHILVKPTRPDLRTNLVINTDRRTYHLELRATPQAYMASVSWRYPQDALLAVRRSAEQAAEQSRRGVQDADVGVDLDHLDFRYRIKGPHPSWRPVQVFDDGRQTFIEFPADVAQGDLPPLFVIGADGKSAELVNYRVEGQHMVVDRLFLTAELRIGDRQTAQRVRIEKDR